MNAQGLSNVIWSLGTMGARYSDLPAPLSLRLAAQICERAVDFTDQGFANILWGMHKMQVL